MVHRIAVTGHPGIGKSTLVQKVAAASGARVGGVLARDKRYKDRRIGFELLDLGSGATGMLADETGDGPQLGKYRVRLDDLDSVGAKAVENALNSRPHHRGRDRPHGAIQPQVHPGGGEGDRLAKTHAGGAARVVQSPSGQEDSGDISR